MEKEKIYYIYDALCGWCYGFSEVINSLHQHYKDQIDFEVISGGMVRGNRIGPIGEVAGYIKEAYLVVENRTGVSFGEDFLSVLDVGKTIFTSIPAAKAMAIFRSQKREESIAFASSLQQAIYFHGKAPSDPATFADCAADFDMDRQKFLEAMEHPKLDEIIQAEFQTVEQWGVQGFPTVVYQKGDTALRLTNGYVPYPDLEEALGRARKHMEEISS